MPMEQTIWSLDARRPLDSAALNSETELEELICGDISILSRDWLIVNRQVRTQSGKYIDILCIDRDGDMVVVELKKSMTPREVTAQTIDYAASVSHMSIEDIAQEYLKFSNGRQSLSAAYKTRFGTALDENSVNQRVKMVIVAAQMDDGTERIIRFLRDTYGVDINILFFRIFRCGGERLLSRVWFEEAGEESAPAEPSRSVAWNGEYYVSFGETNDARNWEDARKYGFISAGGGSWYSKTLALLSPGDRIWVNIPHTGYVGAGIVTKSWQKACDAEFETDGVLRKMNALPLAGSYFAHAEDPELAEYVVGVKWLVTVDRQSAVKELGFFGNQNSVCRPQTDKWPFTVNRLKSCWHIE